MSLASVFGLPPLLARIPSPGALAPAGDDVAAQVEGRGLLRKAALRAGAWGGYLRGAVPMAVRRRVLGRLTLDAQEGAREIAAGLALGRTPPARWYDRMRAFLPARHHAAASATAGTAAPDAGVLGQVRGLIATQLGFLGRFRQQVASGAQAIGAGLVARAEMYGAAVWATGQKVQNAFMRRAGYGEERAVRSATDSCATCLDRAARGWQPIGTLTPIGEGECRTRCKCHLIYRNRAAGPRQALQAARRAATDVVPVELGPTVAAVGPALSPAGRGPASPILPDRPLAERLAAYTEGDRKVEALVARGAASRNVRRDLREAQFRIDNLPAQVDTTPDPALKARLTQSYDRSLAQRDAAKAELARLTAADRAHLHEIAATARPQQWQHVGKGVDHPAVGARIRESDEFLAPLFESYTDEVQKVKWAARTKAGYRANYSKAREINLSVDDDTTIAIHERGHQIEDAFPGIGHQAKLYLRHRVGDEPLKPMEGGGHGADELGRDDDFGRYFGAKAGRYVGKHYDDGSEILSMGLQALHEDPVGFASKDPEYAKWVLGVLDGSLR